jgi:hypothetical protein
MIQGTPQEVLEALTREPVLRARVLELLSAEFLDAEGAGAVEAVAGDPGHADWERLNRQDLDVVLSAAPDAGSGTVMESERR